MRRFMLVCLLVAAALGIAALGNAQVEQPKLSTTPNKGADLARYSPAQRHVYLSGQRAMEWLQRSNRPDGRFLAGFVPALRVPVDRDSYADQAGAALALARAARFYGSDQAAAIARQALLTLLSETSVDPRQPHLRNVPVHQSSPLIAAGLLVAAIHELPAPAADLLEQGDQLANFVRAQLQNDGALKVNGVSDQSLSDDVRYHQTGPALYGIIRSQALQPAAWKLEALRKAHAYYLPHWKANKNLPLAVLQTPAYAEAYLLTKERAFAEAVFEMCDWLCTLQYQQANSTQAAWTGGFQRWIEGKALPLPPTIQSAAAILSLSEACRVARAAGAVQEYQRYRRAVENGMQYLTALQYTEANTQHFADWYRPALVGAYHASHQDGDLRIEYVQDALLATVRYLEHAVD